MFVRFVAEFDRLQREQGVIFMFAELVPSWQETIKAAFLRTVEQIEIDLY